MERIERDGIFFEDPNQGSESVGGDGLSGKALQRVDQFDGRGFAMQISSIPVFTEDDKNRAKEIEAVGQQLSAGDNKEYEALMWKRDRDLLRRLLPEVMEDITTNDFYPGLPYNSRHDARAKLSDEERELLVRKIRLAANRGNPAAIHAAVYFRARNVKRQAENSLWNAMGHWGNYRASSTGAEQIDGRLQGIDQATELLKLQAKLELARWILECVFDLGIHQREHLETWDAIFSVPSMTKTM